LVNSVLLIGNLTHAPYFDLIEGSGVPFLRFYLGVTLPRDLAHTLLHGNLSQPPYFARVGSDDRPFLRFYMAVDRPDRREGRSRADFLRVVAYDDRALFDYPYLQPGSEVVVSGNLRARKRKMGGGKEKTVVEVVADPVGGITFLHKINHREGDAHRERVLAERAAGGGGEQSQADRQVMGGGFFRVVAYGDLALFSYNYLQAGSGVFVQGRLQSRRPPRRKEMVVEVVARNIKFLTDIDEEAGNAARDRIRAERAAQGETV
jgi:single-stranded DNA-binding protein